MGTHRIRIGSHKLLGIIKEYDQAARLPEEPPRVGFLDLVQRLLGHKNNVPGTCIFSWPFQL